MSNEKKPWQLELHKDCDSYVMNEADPVADPVDSRLLQYRLTDAGRRAIEQ